MKKIFFIFVIAVVLLSSDAFRVFEVDGAETLLALENELVNIECKTDTAMGYCGFVHPSGKRFSFSGASLEAGQCSYQINMTAADSGQWRCNIGRKGSRGLENMKIINVRVTSRLAAIQQNISTVHGKEVTLSCTTVDGRAPLRYCRFEPPAGKPFSINSDVTPEKPILKRYYFPYNKSLDRGDCAVSIRKVKYEDVGRWSCGAGLDDGEEHLDTILLQVEGLYTMSTASTTGLTYGAIAIVALLGLLGFVVWKKRRLLGSVPDEAEHELQRLPTDRSQGPVHGSTHEISSRQGSAHELTSRQGSACELRSQIGSSYEPRSRQGSMHAPSAPSLVHDEPIRRIPLHGSPMTPHRSPLVSHKSSSVQHVPMITINSPSPIDPTADLIFPTTDPIHRNPLHGSPMNPHRSPLVSPKPPSVQHEPTNTINTFSPMDPITDPNIPTTDPIISNTDPNISNTDPSVPTTDSNIPTTDANAPTVEATNE